MMFLKRLQTFIHHADACKWLYCTCTTSFLHTLQVKIKDLNDSHQIGLCLYNVVILSAVGLTLSLLLKGQVVLLYGITSGCLVIGTTLTQAIVFVPKVRQKAMPRYTTRCKTILPSARITPFGPYCNSPYAMVTNHLRAPYGVYLTKKIVRFYGARTAPGRRQEKSYDFLSIFRHRTVPGEV